MGCSASVQTSPDEVKVLPDPDDLDVFPVILLPCSIPEFDAVFEELGAVLTQFIMWNNAISDYAISVQNLLAPALGAVMADVQVGRNVAALQLDLVTPFNKQRANPQHHILLAWLKYTEIKNADEALALARASLQNFLLTSSEPVVMKLTNTTGPCQLNSLEAPDLAETEQEGILAINSYVEQLQRALGVNFAVLLRLTPAAAPLRGKLAVTQLYRCRNREGPLEADNLAPATVVDIFNSGMTDAILKVCATKDVCAWCML
jgi:hypothetical protein